MKSLGPSLRARLLMAVLITISVPGRPTVNPTDFYDSSQLIWFVTARIHDSRRTNPSDVKDQIELRVERHIRLIIWMVPLTESARQDDFKYLSHAYKKNGRI